MKITVKLKYRSRCRTVTGQQNANSAERGASTLLGRAEERENISGVTILNQFPDLGKKLLEPAKDALPSAVAGASENLEKVIQLDQIPREEVQVHPSSRIVVHTDPRSPGADRFRFLRMCLRELWSAGKLKSLQITSPLPQDGKSTIALNLATSLAEGGKRTVLLIEADLHHPTLSEQLRIERRVGLADCLEGNLNPMSALRRLDPLGWYLLPSGEPRSNPTELLQTDAFAGVLQKVSPHFDWILVDSPPVLPLTDALSLARQVNASLMVAREGRTPREAIEKAISVLGRQRVLGIILNAMEGLDRLYSGYYGYNGYSGGNEPKTFTPASIPKESVVRLGIANHSASKPPER
jgi:capsular exopolysaccharide synthesis family protein